MRLTKTLQEFNMTAPATTTASEKYQPIITKYQPIQIRRCFEIQMKSLFKRPRHRCFPVKLLRTRLFIEHLQILLLEEHKILLKTVPMAIPNDVSKACYQKGLVIYFLRSTYSRFMKFLIEAYNKGFSCY